MTYSVTGILDYFTEMYRLLSKDEEAGSSVSVREQVEFVYEKISIHEEQLCKMVLEFLLSYQDVVTIIGSTSWERAHRVPTISFVVKGVKSQSFVEELDKHNIGIRFGHFYAYRLIESLGLDIQQGVVRVSLVHYNTTEEVSIFISKIEPILNRARESVNRNVNL
jgi:selenocysteine lyase/cysteine desulfurase